MVKSTVILDMLFSGTNGLRTVLDSDEPGTQNPNLPTDPSHLRPQRHDEEEKVGS